MAELPLPLVEAFGGRTRGEIDFIFTIASMTGARYEAALAAYLAALKDAADTALKRIAAARDRRR